MLHPLHENLSFGTGVCKCRDQGANWRRVAGVRAIVVGANVLELVYVHKLRTVGKHFHTENSSALLRCQRCHLATNMNLSKVFANHKSSGITIICEYLLFVNHNFLRITQIILNYDFSRIIANLNTSRLPNHRESRSHWVSRIIWITNSCNSRFHQRWRMNFVSSLVPQKLSSFQHTAWGRIIFNRLHSVTSGTAMEQASMVDRASAIRSKQLLYDMAKGTTDSSMLFLDLNSPTMESSMFPHRPWIWNPTKAHTRSVHRWAIGSNNENKKQTQVLH